MASGLLVATTYAAASGSHSDEYRGCVNAKTGVLRMIEPGPGGDCHERAGSDREVPITWKPAETDASSKEDHGGHGKDEDREHDDTSKPHTGSRQTDSSSRRGTTVKTRTASAAIPTTDFVTVLATCENGEVPIGGYALVDGEELFSSDKASYSVGDTGDRMNGYQVRAAKPYTNPYALPGAVLSAPGEQVTAVVRCLVTG